MAESSTLADHDQLMQDLYDLCHNEVFESYRDFEEPLGRFSRAFISEKFYLDFDEVCSWSTTALQRAGYLISLLCGVSEDEVCKRFVPFLDRLLDVVKLKGCESVPLYHADRADGFDTLAKEWGLTRGINFGRFLKLITPPYIV